jgi:hypothetical protein
MKIVKVIYDDKTSFILDIVNNLDVKVLIDSFNIDDYRQKKKALPIMTRNGTTQVPLVVFADENLDEYAAIWSETKPDWELEIKKILENE